MARKRPDGIKKRGLPIWASISLIVVFGLLALSLVYVAFQQVGQSDKNEGFSTINPVNAESPSQTETSEPDSSDAEDSEGMTSEEAISPEAEPQASTPVVPKRLIALDANLAVRSTVGECTAGTPGSIEFSHDGGTTWRPSAAFEQTSATQVLRLLPSANGTTFAVALNSECAPQIYSTADAGETWSAPVAAVGTWYLNPAEPRSLGAPGGAKTIGCDAVSLSPMTDSNVGVLCADGSLISTSNGGATWSDPIPAEQGLTLAYSKEQLVLASQGKEGCEGISLGDVNGDGTSCISVNVNEIGSGDLAFAQSGSNVLAWVGESALTSRDGGQSWQ